MSIAKALKEYKPTRLGTACYICTLVSTLPEAESKPLAAAIADPATYTSAGLSRLLSAEGYKIGDGAIARHRRGECRGL